MNTPFPLSLHFFSKKLKSDVGHVHDDRYYTESEIDTALTDYLQKAGDIATGSIRGPDFINTKSGTINRTGDYISSVVLNTGRTITITRDG